MDPQPELDPHVRQIRNIQLLRSDLQCLLPNTETKINGTVLNAYRAQLQNEADAAVLLVGGTDEAVNATVDGGCYVSTGCLLGYHASTGWLLGSYWACTGRLLGIYWAAIGRVLGGYWANIFCKVAQYIIFITISDNVGS
ncbi:hypothetical protein OE88DRAFT_1648420 [Heliocybe sulcata]|uniref:Uncharacterized protein n=1 Tax=Heliocybe sulcata TaxID=5364 RepID=A0A5C3MMJ2_9AGAM|nr:hypothetical protein OE88DRAFT_1648420 [Heliocybe sulcata]